MDLRENPAGAVCIECRAQYQRQTASDSLKTVLALGQSVALHDLKIAD